MLVGVDYLVFGVFVEFVAPLRSSRAFVAVLPQPAIAARGAKCCPRKCLDFWDFFAQDGPLPGGEAADFVNFVGFKVAEFVDSRQESSRLCCSHYPRLPVRHGGRSAVRATAWYFEPGCGFGIS